jgi:hypothetical protein
LYSNGLCVIFSYSHFQSLFAKLGLSLNISRGHNPVKDMRGDVLAPVGMLDVEGVLCETKGKNGGGVEVGTCYMIRPLRHPWAVGFWFCFFLGGGSF